MPKRLLYALALWSAAFAAHASDISKFDTGRSAFAVKVKGQEIDYREFAVFAMPGERVSIELVKPAGGLQVNPAAGDMAAIDSTHWAWTAPSRPGYYPIDISRDDGTKMRLQAFVMVPADQVHDGWLNGYHIGKYPRRNLKGREIYTPPAGFIEVTPELARVRISPHFTLGEFLCKQAGGYPKYVVLQQRLLLKLETVVNYLHTQGVPREAIHIMSGYRTPWYNAQLGNVPYSRHTWGDAADVYIDAVPGDHMAGDLNHDGRDDRHDSALFAADVNRLFRKPQYDYLRGGLGAYPATSRHLPFVHMDTRGFRARW